jgi:hypothetical protein
VVFRPTPAGRIFDSQGLQESDYTTFAETFLDLEPTLQVSDELVALHTAPQNFGTSRLSETFEMILGRTSD